MARPKKEKQDAEVRFKYLLRCKNCGLVWRYQKLVAIIRNYEHYHCDCGGKLEMEELE